MVDYVKLQKTAARLIKANGQSATVRRAGTPTGDPWNPTAGTNVDTLIQVVETTTRKRDQNGTLITETRRTLIALATAGVVPLKSDVICVGTAPADVTTTTIFEEILEVRPLSPGGIDLFYEIDLAI